MRGMFDIPNNISYVRGQTDNIIQIINGYECNGTDIFMR